MICTSFICVQYSGMHLGCKTRPWSIHFHENQSNEIQVISCALTEMTKLLVTCHKFENVTTMQPETTGHPQAMKRSATDNYGKVWPSEPFANIQQDSKKELLKWEKCFMLKLYMWENLILFLLRIWQHCKDELSWFGHVQRMPNTRTVKKIFNWKPLTKRSRGRPKYRWEDNIKQDICQMKIKNWIACVQDRGKCKKVVEKAKTFK